MYDENAVAVIFDDCISKKIVRHVPFNWSNLASMFLKVPNSCIRGTVTGKRVNRGAGLGLKIPMDYTFYNDARVVLWLEKAFKKIAENKDAKVAKCLEYTILQNKRMRRCPPTNNFRKT